MHNNVLRLVFGFCVWIFEMNLKKELDDSFEDVHCMPDDGKHECSKKCWCQPELNADFRDEDGRRLWVHRELQ